MVSIQQLKHADPSFSLCSKIADKEEVNGVCLPESLRDGGVVFIRSMSYFDKLHEQVGGHGSSKRVGVIFQESFLKDCNGEVKGDLLKRFRFHATVGSIDLAMGRFSKVFFDASERIENRNIDGRRNGTADIHPTSSVAEDVFVGEYASIAEDVVIHPGCVILAHSIIGKGSVLYPNVAVYPEVKIGENCIVHANCTIGSDGFSYNYDNGRHIKVWHIGGVVIEDDVEIGSNTAIDQGTFSPTVIGEGSKIDNHVHIAHNCRLGQCVVICGQSGLAGSVTVGDHAVIGGAVNIAPGVTIGACARIGGMSGVTGDVPDKAEYGGHPARPLKQWLRSMAFLRKMSLKTTKKNKST